MILQAEKHTLKFIKPAKTSRGSYLEKEVLLLSLENKTNRFVAEVAPLSDLSVDGKVDLLSVLSPFIGQQFNHQSLLNLLDFCKPYPSLRFGVYCLIKKLENTHEIWTNSPFTNKLNPIEINGLVWMNEIEAMAIEAEEKVQQGFRCVKFKVGALDFDSECRMLEVFRKNHPSSKVEIRLDANGAFPGDLAKSMIKDLSRFEIHSIEQPIGVGNHDQLGKLCREANIDIALDEELIGVDVSLGKNLLKEIKPQYIILKPTLIGGFDLCDTWIQIAQLFSIKWWSTSALEGNIGLFDIAQWVSSYSLDLPQGLGTGSLFVKNFPAKTKVENGYLFCL